MVVQPLPSYRQERDAATARPVRAAILAATGGVPVSDEFEERALDRHARLLRLAKERRRRATRRCRFPCNGVAMLSARRHLPKQGPCLQGPGARSRRDRFDPRAVSARASAMAANESEGHRAADGCGEAVPRARRRARCSERLSRAGGLASGGTTCNDKPELGPIVGPGAPCGYVTAVKRCGESRPPVDLRCAAGGADEDRSASVASVPVALTEVPTAMHVVIEVHDTAAS